MVAVLVGIVTAYVVAMLVMPLLVRAAWAWGVLDHPGAGHHVHGAPVPRLGGVAVFAGFIAGVVAAAAVSDVAPRAARAVLEFDHRAVALVVAGGILFVIGLFDDLKDIPPAVKLVGQTAAATVVCYYGFRIDVVSLVPGTELHLGWLALPVSILWIVGVSNAFNLIDGLDGLAGGVALIALAATTCSAILLGDSTVPWYALLLAGSLLAFLRFNYPPARIFLGDSGSLVVGFLLAVLTVKGATRPDGSVSALIPLFALSYPLLDTGIAILRRWLRGVPLSRADDRHIHHQLRALGLTPTRAVGLIYLESAGVALFGLCTAFAPPELTVAMTAGCVALFVAILVAIVRWLGYHEFLELSDSIVAMTRDARGVLQRGIAAREVARAIADADTFDEVVAVLERSAPALHCAYVTLGPEELGPARDIELGSERRLWKLDCPIVPSRRDIVANEVPGVDALLLTLWYRTGEPAAPTGTEHVARILTPALTNWITAHSRGEPGIAALPLHRMRRRQILSPVLSADAQLSSRDKWAVRSMP
ncbi:MAG: UDP-N-acetylmuramyl pentapeptide phosphotransferase/UDP-N-acetylglucosamine-phosphate transferase [Gemmatimonadetes bacterium]|nr:UDP-N-acetylmuramyl pentapeptide phosphotransferase/UDP-N-acetylglucosamine-phosphate transferase [Gemmatimonadota bacterium]